MSTTTLTSSFGVKSRSNFWAGYRESTLNWLALGLLLAAWNSADDTLAKTPPRPAALQGYDMVSVRAVQRFGPS